MIPPQKPTRIESPGARRKSDTEKGSPCPSRTLRRRIDNTATIGAGEKGERWNLCSIKRFLAGIFYVRLSDKWGKIRTFPLEDGEGGEGGFSGDR